MLKNVKNTRLSRKTNQIKIANKRSYQPSLISEMPRSPGNTMKTIMPLEQMTIKADNHMYKMKMLLSLLEKLKIGKEGKKQTSHKVYPQRISNA